MNNQRSQSAYKVGPLFESFKLGNLNLKNRVVMAPMTRAFSPGGVPGPNVAAYYRRRAENGVGLIITEGTLIDDPDELATFLAPLADAGVDVFHCSTRRFWEPEFAGSDLGLAGWVKKLSAKPTITVGSVGLDNEFISSFRGENAETANVGTLIEKLNNREFDLRWPD